MAWEAQRVLALAPDAAAVQAGRAQAVAARWTDPGASDAAVWGTCRGSGAASYRTCVELAGPAYRCSCPSRKSPCKHALGLLLLWAGGAVPARPDGEPDWVRGWLAERAQRAERAERRSERATAGPRDPAAAARRAEQRAQRVAAGAAELRDWLADRLRAGLGGIAAGGAEELYAVAGRMVDAQAPGLAGGLRRAAGVVGRGRDWPGRLLSELALLHLLVEASTRLDELPPDLAATVRTRLGLPTAAAAVLEHGERVVDEWQVLGVSDEVTERLTTRRAWLRGRASGRPALVLSFAPPGQPLDASLPAGRVVRAALAFHPGAAPLRAVVADHDDPIAAPCPPGDPVAAALDSYARAVAADPWLDRWPVLLADVVPAPHRDGWALADPDGDALPLAERVDPWPLLAVSAGAPTTVAGEWTPAGLRPLTCWDGDRVVSL